MTAAAPAIDIDSVTVRYGERTVLDGVSAQIAAGRITGIVGPNGAGKSTLLGTVLGHVPNSGGRVTITHDTALVGYMPQTAGVDWDFPVTVYDTVLMGTYGSLKWFRRPGARQRQIARDALAEAGISDLADQPIGQLSGGQRKRTFLARLLAQQSDLLIMDEPFAGVDAASERAIREVLEARHAKGASVVLVHHDLGTVADICHDVVIIGPGFLASGPVETTLIPENVDRAYGLGGTFSASARAAAEESAGRTNGTRDAVGGR